MIRFVRSWDEIRENLLTLEGYRVSSDSDLANYYRGIIRLGKCFVAYESKGRTIFGPSRFIGYARNDRQRHENNFGRDGRETNPEIQKILRGRFQSHAALESRFQNFCHEHDIEPAKKNRRFIPTGSSALEDSDFLIDDLSQIKASKLRATEKQQLVQARIGQGQFRAALMRIWKGCPVTGCKTESLLRASHIKPWRACSNQERLEAFNGLLLAPNADSAFDKGLISFAVDGRMVISSRLKIAEAAKLGLKKGTKIRLHKRHLPFLDFHRKRVFQK